MRAEITGGDKSVVVRLQGRFTFDAHSAFTEAGERAIAHGAPEIHVNLSKVEVMDSAGLGMLLRLRKKAGLAGKSVFLTECSSAAAREIKFANFQGLFRIGPAGLERYPGSTFS